MEPPTNSNGRRSSVSNSPEFEFWMIRNPSSQQPTLHSADELFSDGILLPLQLLNTQNTDDPPDKNPTTEPTNTPSISPNPDDIHGSDLKTTFSSSKRWKDIFKKNPESKQKEKKKKDRNGGSGAGAGTGTAELNINIWPFSRSRSAGNGGSRPRTVVGNRKVSSAPCSRSNSTGDKYRRWPSSPGRSGAHLGRSSPGRAGVHLGRSSPVWQVKRFGQSRSLHDNLVRSTAEKVGRSKKSTAGQDTTNVPTSISYRQRMSCRSDLTEESNNRRVAGGNAGVSPVTASGEGGASSLFNLRSLFTKKVF